MQNSESQPSPSTRGGGYPQKEIYPLTSWFTANPQKPTGDRSRLLVSVGSEVLIHTTCSIRLEADDTQFPPLDPPPAEQCPSRLYVSGRTAPGPRLRFF